MTTRFVKGQARTETPRLKDLHATAGTARERSAGRDGAGRFTVGNDAANGRGATSIIVRSLRGAPPELAREAEALYRAIMRDLPSDGPSVRQLTASRCRHAMLATRLADEAVKVGLTTTAGLKLAEQSRAHDLAAQRLAVTAFDLATRDAAATGARPVDLARAMVEAGKPRVRDAG